jgi:dolichol-phosphate mannosyltransferase
MKKLLLLVPTYNESASIEALIKRVAGIRSALKTLIGGDVQMLVIDDNSPDGTATIVAGLGEEWIEILPRSEKSGLGPAYIAGFIYGLSENFDFMVEMDADLSHQPEELTAMIKPVADGSADLTIGTRWMPGGKIVNWPLTRQFISRAGTTYARVVLGIKLRDITSGFRVFRAEVLRSINFDRIESKGYGFQIEMALEALENGFRVEEVPITFVERVDGVSKMNKAIVMEALWKVTIWGLQRLVKRR